MADTVKLTKLSVVDDIEAYLTTFESMIHAHKIPKDSWVLKLPLQLTGKAHQWQATRPWTKLVRWDML